MNAITARITAWLSSYQGLDVLRGDDDSIVSALHLTNSTLDMTTQGWTRVGSAELTLELDREQDIVSGKVASLRAQQTAVRAKAESMNTQLETAIQNLLSIGFDAPRVHIDDTDIPF